MMWPDWQQPQTKAPVIGQVNNENKGDVLKITCATEGASIAYKMEEEEDWQLYTGPIAPTKGTAITAKAIRYGYLPRAEVRYKE